MKHVTLRSQFDPPKPPFINNAASENVGSNRTVAAIYIEVRRAGRSGLSLHLERRVAATGRSLRDALVSYHIRSFAYSG